MTKIDELKLRLTATGKTAALFLANVRPKKSVFIPKEDLEKLIYIVEDLISFLENGQKSEDLVSLKRSLNVLTHSECIDGLG